MIRHKRLHRIGGLFAGILLLVLCFVPVTTAFAEALPFDGVDFSGFPENKELSPDYGIAADILERNLKETGTELNAEQRVYDFCGRFGSDELEELNEWIAAQEEESGISIRVFTAAMEMYYEKYFLEECADRLCDNGFAKEDLALFLLNLDETDRGVCIQGYGLCEDRLSDDRIEYILDDVIECFRRDEYADGIQLFAKEAAYYAQSANYNSYYKDNSVKAKLHRMPWLILIVVPAGIAALGIVLMRNGGIGRQKVSGKTYIVGNSSGLTASRDEYMRSSVSKSYAPRSSGSSSGGRSSGGGGRSRGGRSHSGGSRRF